MKKHLINISFFLLLVSYFFPPSVYATPGGKYLSILFPRSVYNTATDSGFVNLDVVKSFLDSKNIKATVSVITSWHDESQERNTADAIYPSWAYIRSLQDAGWVVTSHSRYYAFLNTVGNRRVYEEVRGSLKDLMDRGFTKAWSLFSYPNGNTTAYAKYLVKKTYSFGRVNAGGVNWLPDRTPEIVTVFTAQGGHCNDASLPCYTVVEPTRTYMMPSYLIGKINSLSQNQWAILQAWRFVEGTADYPSASWNCEGDEQTHFSIQRNWPPYNTQGRELYCFNDFQRIIESLDPSIVVTTPDVVASLYGRAKPTLEESLPE